MRYRAYIFDFDYTLADATDGIVESFNHALTARGYATAPSDAIRRTVGMTLENAFSVLSGAHDKDELEKLRALFRRRADVVMTPHTTLLPGAEELLRRLKASGGLTAIVTSKNHYRISDVLDKYGITDLIDHIIGFEDVKNPKPAPDGIILAMDALRATRDETIYIGDTVIDAQTAHSAGVDFAAVTTGTTGAAEFDGYARVAVLPGLWELGF
jgi:phosphoglycolate phosphatase